MCAPVSKSLVQPSERIVACLFRGGDLSAPQTYKALRPSTTAIKRVLKLCHYFAHVLRTYLFPVFHESVDADVVDDVPGADQQRSAVLPEQLEVVRVSVVAQEAGGRTWK